MAFGSIVFTTRGKVLQSKAQTGTKLNFTKLAIGDGELGSQAEHVFVIGLDGWGAYSVEKADK